MKWFLYIQNSIDMGLKPQINPEYGIDIRVLFEAPNENVAKILAKHHLELEEYCDHCNTYKESIWNQDPFIGYRNLKEAAYHQKTHAVFITVNGDVIRASINEDGSVKKIKISTRSVY